MKVALWGFGRKGRSTAIGFTGSPNLRPFAYDYIIHFFSLLDQGCPDCFLINSKYCVVDTKDLPKQEADPKVK